MARYGLMRAPLPQEDTLSPEEPEEGRGLVGGWVEVAVCCRSRSGGREGRQAAVGVQRAEAQAG